MPLALLTVVETPPYLRDAAKLLSEAERADVVDLIAADPLCGDVVKGGGGIRKVRIALAGRGKRSGARVIYFFHNATMPAYLWAIFAKNERTDLRDAEVAALAKLGKAIVKAHGGP
ncbi:MAG TPA: type II toxin-antitoxin system RelE/ParE family toxin [Stellaceae bacterium]|nr:type II toxin-antitoxin system RelE/ParE family toxin [Stellaceae bacterium]